MEVLKRERTILRGQFTRTLNELKQKMEAVPLENEDVTAAFKIFEDKASRLLELEERFRALLFASENYDAQAGAKEYEAAEEYREKWIAVKSRYDNLFIETVNVVPESSAASVSSYSPVKNLRLPKLELKAFDGNIRNWLGFWGQFRKINDDTSIDDEDKFQYLIQATVPGSSARELVESFPPSGPNYSKAIEQLKARFARDELLIETYVRELLGLVMIQAADKETMNLGHLYDRLETQLRALETLGVTSDKYAAMLYPLVESALPEDILKAWERARAVTRVQICDPSDGLANLLQFLKLEVESEERLQLARSGISGHDFNSVRSENVKGKKVPSAACIFSGESRQHAVKCLWCDKTSHAAADCFKARAMLYDQKRALLKSKNCCFVCLKSGHSAKKCRSYVKCLICLKRHLTIMCPEIPIQTKTQSVEPDQGKSVQSQALLTQKSGVIFLQTVMVKIVHNGKIKEVRALFDSGAQRSYISKDVVEQLNMKPSGKEMLSHSLFGGVETNQQQHNIYDIIVRSMDGKFQGSVSVLDQAKICGYVPRVQSQGLYPKLREKNIILSDMGKNPPDIGLLIGADISGLFLTGSRVQLDGALVAIETKLGWTLQGPGKSPNDLLANITYNCNLDLSDLWKLDIIGISEVEAVKVKENPDNETILFFNETVKINEEDRYEVQLPWKEGHPELLDNKDLAERRLNGVTKQLLSRGQLENYHAVFQDWLQAGIIETVPECEVKGHFLPHQAVIKPSSQTTKIRPVFDASAKDRKGNSLNDCLEKGPNLIELIPKLIIQFRKHAIGISADIKKAFLQISLSSSDRDFLKFLWWSNIDAQEKICFRHRRVVFGVSSSPFLLAATITHHLNHAPKELRNTADILKKAFYVDNCITSLESEESVSKFVKESTQLMACGKFELRDWVTAPKLRQSSRESKNVVPVLGISWDIENDTLFSDVSGLILPGGPITKRVLLSITQRIFDPVGYSCPTMLIPKLILQQTWKQKCGWDVALPEEITHQFLAWLKHLHHLSNCRIPRRLTEGPYEECEKTLHVFSDASKVSFAACVFLRADFDGRISVRLVECKARVAPLKQLTIPRLELLGAVIATRLGCHVKEALGLSDCKTYYWSDSAVVLSWIKGKAGEWNTFVGNRIKEIQQHSHPTDWHHIPGSLNPADIPSRGCNAKLLEEGQWWEGPEWLRREQSEWPSSDEPAPDQEIDAERRKTVIASVFCEKTTFTSSLTYFSKYSKIVRMIGWMLRFINNCHKDCKRSGEMTCEETQAAEKKLLKCIQNESSAPSEKKVIKEIQTFTDDEGLMRVRTKLILGDECDDFKCPIVLSGKNLIVERMVRQKHHHLKHAGLQTLLSNLREKYWITGIRRLARKVIYECVSCKRFRGKAIEPPFAPLPQNRIKCAAVFQVTGIDLAGPLYLTTGEKVWVVLFTCAIYRAVHLELTKSLSTDSFLLALRRFIARRGRISTVYTDNGTNFVGTSNALRTVDWKKIMSFSSVHEIKWNFNPPTAAWWGGWWERLVRTLKELLRRNLGRATLTYDELETLLCDCEAIMNSRPLTYTEDEFENLKPLTPADFVQGIPRSEVPDLDAIDSRSLNRRLRYLQSLRVSLRQRFRNEYLALLIHRGQRRQEQLKVGDVVLVEEDGKRTNWPLGVVLEVYPGQDGYSRVAKVKTAVGEKLRPVQRLYPLEVSSSCDDSKLFQQMESSKVDCDVDVPSDNPEVITTRAGRRIKVPKRLDL